jgi:hypothetical protein
MTAAPQASRPCPFCKGVVPPDVALHGGNCPHCMLEIPGEEAPTDPGAQLRAKHDAERRVAEVRARKLRRVRNVLAVFVFALASTAAYTYNEKRKADLVYELEDYDFVSDAALRRAPVQPKDEPGAAAAASSQAGTAQRRLRPRSSQAGAEDGAATAGTSVAADAGAGETLSGSKPSSASGDSTVKMVETTRADGGIGTSAVALKVTRPNASTCATDDEIKDMAREVINAYAPQLEACYNQALKVDESLSGRWKVMLTIAEDGTATKVKVAAVSTTNADLEACFVRNVEKWRFRKVYRAFPLAKTFSFGAAW